MKKLPFILCLLLAQTAWSQQAAVVKFDRLETLLATKSDKIQVINFWATWCAPCVKELPYLEQLASTSGQTVDVTLVCLDYADKLDKVNEFIKRKSIKSAVLLLDEIDYNAWIDNVDTQWSGAIPATLVFNPKTGQRKFVEKELQEGDLQKLIEELKLP